MDKEFAEKLNVLFQRSSQDTDDNIADGGRVSIEWVAGLVNWGLCNHSLSHISPAGAALALEKLYDPNGFHGRPDFLGKKECDIHPVNLKISSEKPDRLDLVLSFLQLNSPAKVRMDVPHKDVSEYPQSYEDFVEGPSLKEFAEYLRTLEKWSDIDFTRLCEAEPVQKNGNVYFPNFK